MNKRVMVPGRGVATVLVGENEMLIRPHVVAQLVQAGVVTKVRGKFQAVEHFAFWDAMKKIQD